MLEITNENATAKVMEITIDGKVTTEAMERIYRQIERRADEWGKINILEKYITMDRFEARAFWLDLRLYFRNREYFNKVAIVTDKKWVNILTRMIGPFMRFEVKAFSIDQIQSARNWLI